MAQYTDIIDDEINKHLNNLNIPNQLKESMLYSFTAGGKRIRPLLLIASYLGYRSDFERVLSTAVALEMIHTYSLIHDDLPAMDDDDLRRGQPTNHKVFDEATAILAGDALLTYSFEVIATDAHLSDSEKVEVMTLLSKCSGPKGMVAGQILDMEAENKPVNLAALEEIHHLKTGQLLTFAIAIGARLGGATGEEIKHLKDFSYYLGLIFQVQDDILDVIGNAEQLGKPVGSDEDNQKSTYPKLLGLEGAKKQKDHYVLNAKESLGKIFNNRHYLLKMLDFLTERTH